MFLIVLGGDPAGSEGAEAGEGRGTLPHGVLAVGRGDNADLRAGRSLGEDLSLKTVGKTLVHGGTTGKNDVLAKIFTDIDIGGLDGGPGEVVHRLAGLAVEFRLEKELRAGHTDGSGDGDDALIGHGVGNII
jgi:hypothetical protein